MGSMPALLRAGRAGPKWKLETGQESSTCAGVGGSKDMCSLMMQLDSDIKLRWIDVCAGKR